MLRSATQLATGVAGRVSEAIGFDEILQRAPAESEVAPVQDAAAADELKQQLTDRIRLKLAKHSIDLNQGVELRVNQDGSMRVEGNHPQGAEIEALLNSDPDSARLAGELAKTSGANQISIDLTSSGAPGNMFGPGGYPNW